MNILLLFAILNQTDIDKFLNNTLPHLSYLVNGSEILSDTKRISFGIEGNYSDYELIHYNYVARTPGFNSYVAVKQGRFAPYLKVGFYPKNRYTNKSAPYFTIGLNLLPKFSESLIFRFSYGTLCPIEYFPGDPYFNYRYTNFHCFNLSLVGLKKIALFTPFLTVGFIPSYVSGKYRNDINRIEEDFSKFILGWQFGLGFKLFFVKFNAGLVNNRLSASTSINL